MILNASNRLVPVASEARADADTLHRSAVDAPAGRDARSVGAFVRRQP